MSAEVDSVSTRTMNASTVQQQLEDSRWMASVLSVPIPSCTMEFNVFAVQVNKISMEYALISVELVNCWI